MIRKIAIPFSALGGVMGALKLIDMVAKQADATAKVDLFSGEGCLFAVPVCIVGALIGAMLGGALFPHNHR